MEAQATTAEQAARDQVTPELLEVLKRSWVKEERAAKKARGSSLKDDANVFAQALGQLSSATKLAQQGPCPAKWGQVS